ncbi:AGAP008871-PA-like protein [Anopheles sinensis]|uniref:AGAP008871-PA-like protein n=1 Tax=Anopheles sinensis TaxID=74873 RepID=A0A084VYM0_ANOSI|nr:AGAP008871-PA-like protein [Anopheles sinensis]
MTRFGLVASVLMVNYLLVAGSALVAGTNSDFSSQRTCEPIRIELCRGIGYNETSLPNIVGHELQSDANFTLQTFFPLIQFGCSKQLKFFLCATYVPMCTTKVSMPIGPCRSLCNTVKNRCHPILQGFGFPWPSALDCNRFPEENNQEHMCMEGPGEPLEGEVLVSDRPSCQRLQKSNLYVQLNRSGRCAPLCDADILFEQNEKHFAEVWLTSWSVAALGTAIVATLCLILSTKRWDKSLMPLVISHCLVTVGWAVRWLAGRNATACGYDPQLPGVALLLTDGLSTAPCAATFLLRYYFGLSAAVWWMILCLRWSKAVRRQLNAELGSPSDLHAEKPDSSHDTLFQLAAWGIPALLTVIVLVARLVDADELFGSCFIGNQSDKALLTFVIVPLLTSWVIGSGYLFTAYLRKRSAAPPLVHNLPVHIHGMGKFLFIYAVPSAALLMLMFYDGSGGRGGPSKLPLGGGSVGGCGGIGGGGVGGGSVYKQSMGPKLGGFGGGPTSTYSTASYQTVCPQNSLVSVSIGKLPPSRHGTRKYPSHSHINRKPRSYKMSTQTISLTGNETVL